ncbi:MAG: hypothetical protein WCR51_07705 [Planctomycetia bacterium]
MAVVSELETPPVRAAVGVWQRGAPSWRALVACACAAVAVAGGFTTRAAEPPTATSLPELVRTKHRVFSIPFRLPAAQTPDAAPQRVVLSVSTDLGVTWTQAAEAAPNAGSFNYRAEADGEYWFQLRAIDTKGRSRGGAGPDIRVLVDAAGPKIAARVWKGADGEIVCRYAAVDDSLRLDSLAVEYRGKGDQGWKKITAEGVLSRESPAHLVGEEIWWAGEQVDTLTVKIAISDSSGNNTVRQFTLEPTDPQVDQSALAQELGAPPLPSRETVADVRPTASGGQQPSFRVPDTARSILAPTPAPPPPGGWSAEAATPWTAEAPRTAEMPQAAGSLTSMVAPPSARPPAGIAARAVGTGATQPPITQPSRTAFAGSPSAVLPSGQPPAEYRGKPLQLVKSRRFAWDYEFKAEQSDAGPMRVELWSTRDAGVTWQRTAVDDDAKSPIQVTLPAAGLYGFRLDIVPDLPDIAGGPQPGESPDCWLGVDDEPPTVELIEAARAKPGEPVGMVIRYAAHDQMLVPGSVRLSYAPQADGPWTTIAERLDTQGEYRWQPARTTPAKVHVRIEAADAAGNVGVATTSGAVLVSTPRVVGKLGGVTTLPATP